MSENHVVQISVLRADFENAHQLTPNPPYTLKFNAT